MSMRRADAPHIAHDALLAELEGIRDIYRLDVKQFIGFVRQRNLLIVEGFKQYAIWLDEEHKGKRYSPATINRKIAAAKSRVRYAFKHSAHAGSLRRRYHLDEILKAVKLKKINALPVPSEKILDIEEARKLVRQTKDATIRLMVTFLASTGVRVSEMLGLQLTDLKPARGGLVQVRIKGKGAKERTIYVKTGFLDRIRKHFHGQTYLFEHQGEPYNRISVTNRIKHQALVVLGREVTAQQLRHSWAAIQIKRGRDIKAVATVLGHSDPGLTARMYTEATLKPEEAFLELEEAEWKDIAKMEDDGGRASEGAPAAGGGHQRKADRNRGG